MKCDGYKRGSHDDYCTLHVKYNDTVAHLCLDCYIKCFKELGFRNVESMDKTPLSDAFKNFFSGMSLNAIMGRDIGQP